VAAAQTLSAEIDRFQPAWLTDSVGSEHFGRLLALRERETRAMSSLATRMRLTQGSRYRADKTATATAKNFERGLAPWEYVAWRAPRNEKRAARRPPLSRDPSAGLPIPLSNTSFFLYKQSHNAPLTIPRIAVIYTIDLDELVICRVRFDLNEEDEERYDEAEANEGSL
jgi:hypothetical protein